MRLLLDTHLVVWLAQDPDRVPRGLRRKLEDAESRAIGAPSAYEIAFKTKIGKLPRGQVLIDNWAAVLRGRLAEDLPLTSQDMAKAGGLQWTHRDPFDRMLVAQAQAHDLVLITADRIIREFPDVRTTWA